jgi:hypothetical protein
MRGELMRQKLIEHAAGRRVDDIFLARIALRDDDSCSALPAKTRFAAAE